MPAIFISDVSFADLIRAASIQRWEPGSRHKTSGANNVQETVKTGNGCGTMHLGYVRWIVGINCLILENPIGKTPQHFFYNHFYPVGQE